jgi:hypothetical protein
MKKDAKQVVGELIAWIAIGGIVSVFISIIIKINRMILR